jgi:hypothetical protein
VSEKPLGMKHFWVFRARARQSWSPSSAAGVARDGKDGENSDRMYNRWWPGSQNGNPGLPGKTTE